MLSLADLACAHPEEMRPCGAQWELTRAVVRVSERKWMSLESRPGVARDGPTGGEGAVGLLTEREPGLERSDWCTGAGVLWRASARGRSPCTVPPGLSAPGPGRGHAGARGLVSGEGVFAGPCSEIPGEACLRTEAGRRALWSCVATWRRIRAGPLLQALPPVQSYLGEQTYGSQCFQGCAGRPLLRGTRTSQPPHPRCRPADLQLRPRTLPVRYPGVRGGGTRRGLTLDNEVTHFFLLLYYRLCVLRLLTVGGGCVV